MAFKAAKRDQTVLDFLQVKDFKDILFTYPYRYDKNEIIDFIDWKIDDKVFFRAKLLNKPTINYFSKIKIARFEVLFQEHIIKCTIYNQVWISKLNAGSIINLFGKYKGKNKVSVSTFNTSDLKSQIGLHPVYRLNSEISIKNYRKVVEKVFKHYQSEITDILPKAIKEKYKLLDFKKALQFIHFPNNFKEVKLAKRTLKYHEFMKFHLINILLKKGDKTYKKEKHFNFDDVFSVANSLSFNLTNDQRIATNEILSDLSSKKISKRLLQGDVGSGKTLVAALAMYATVLSNQQAAFMAPTEILAIQQAKYLKELLKKYDVNVVCLYSALKNFKKDNVLEEIENGKANIIVGTHSLIQDKIKFSNLGFVVIDEQQRFGVKQRAALSQKGINVDSLLLSATPIPRTLASIIYSQMDISTIKEMPAGRKKIKTKLILENSMKSILSNVISKINDGEQVYVVCPAIEENDKVDLANVENIYKALYQTLNKKLKLNIDIGLLHGKLDSFQKDEVMKKFLNKESKILVSTTVIEVGVNIKNANIMVIYDADRFGMSQLHQLRGRIGRGLRQGYCFLLTDKKDEEVIERLRFIENNLDGFKISEFDLKLRGPGDIIGTQQSGIANFVLGDLQKDQVMMRYALEDAKNILKNSKEKENKKLIQYIEKYIRENKDILER